MNEENAKIYAVFAAGAVQHFESDVLTPLENEQLVRELQDECGGVEFTVRDVSKPGTTLDAVCDEIEAQKREFDGVVIFGGLNQYRLALTGLPTIAVYNFPGFSHFPYALFAERGVLTATLDRAGICAPDKSAAMFQDLVEKIGLIRALAAMKRSKLLMITDLPTVSRLDGDLTNVLPGDIRQKPAEEYNEIILDKLRESLGVRVDKIGTEEVASNERIQNIDVDEAREVADRWIAGAQEVRGTTEREIINSARMYLAMKILMEEHGANAIATHIRSLTKAPKPEDMIWPSLGNSQLQLEGTVGCCQGHLNVLVSHMVAQHAFGRPSMMGDLMMDVSNNTSIVMHCGASWNPWGGDRRIPYVIRDHAERRMAEHLVPGVGASSEVIFPAGEPATVWRFDVMTQSVILHTGTTVDAYSLYKDLTNMMCRSKLVVELEGARKVQSGLYPDKFGVHRSGTFGDFRQQIKDFGALSGFAVVEEDR